MLLTLLALFLLALAFVVHALMRAPLGMEDEQGFHFLPDTATDSAPVGGPAERRPATGWVTDPGLALMVR